MSIRPIITFKAGFCDLDQSSKPYKVKADPKPGYLYLYSEDDLIHFCWRPRDVPLNQPKLDLVMVPTDGHFVPYDTRTPAHASSKTNGRIFVLKFTSSSQRYLFWLQSKPQGHSGDAAWISPRDRKIGEIVDQLLQGEEVDVGRELSSVRNNNDDGPDNDEDHTMRDADTHGDVSGDGQAGTGGAGPGATGGDIREEGADAREGGADGARAAASSMPGNVAAAVEDFINSLKVPSSKGASDLSGSQRHGKLYPLLTDLLETSVTIPFIEKASDEVLETLLTLLPPTVVVLGLKSDTGGSLETEATLDEAASAKAAMSSSQKRDLLKKVLRSPQFSQSLFSLSVALRDGGLPSVSEALGIEVENGGLLRGGNVPLGGGEAIKAFVEGVKKTVQKK